MNGMNLTTIQLLSALQHGNSLSYRLASMVSGGLAEQYRDMEVGEKPSNSELMEIRSVQFEIVEVMQLLLIVGRKLSQINGDDIYGFVAKDESIRSDRAWGGENNRSGGDNKRAGSASDPRGS